MTRPSKNDLLSFCREGAEASLSGCGIGFCPYLHSSDAWLAWTAGFMIAGMSGAKSCRKGRGHSVKIVTIGGSRIVATMPRDPKMPLNIERS